MFGRRSLLIVISMTLSSILAFIGLFAMTNYLGKDLYGNLSWVLATLGTLNIVADLGFDSAHTKRISEGQDENDCISTYIVIKLILIGVMVTFVFAALTAWNTMTAASLSPETWNLVMLFLLYFIMYDLASIATITFNARMETAKGQLVWLIDPLIRIPLIVFVSMNHMSINELAYAYVFAAMGVILLSTFLLLRGSFRWKKPTLFRSYLKFALPLSFIAIAGAVTVNLDKILIGYFDNQGNVAYYSSAQTLLSTLAIIGTAVSTLAFPSFSKFHRDGDIESIRRVTYSAERYIAMIAIPIVTLIVLFPTEVCVTFFGAQFTPAGDTMRFLAITICLTLLNQVYASQILGVNRPDISAKITLGTFLLNVALLLLFVPKELFGVKMLGMSYTGAAITCALTALIVFLSVRIIVKGLTGTGSNPRILRHVLAGGVAGTVIVSLGTVFTMSGVLSLIIFTAVTMVAFFASLSVFKEFSKSDIDYFLDLVNPKKMFSYMGEEMKNKR
jgi:O-antigen/teichoic acid export membrane protein